MSFIDTAMSFIDGIASVIDVAGAIKGTASEAVSDGIETGFRRIRLPLERTLMRVSLVFVSALFIIWGFALFLDNFMPYSGMGFVIVGALFGTIAMVAMKDKEIR